ncbi:DUF4192 domain-containing protein [Nocardia crassostreae]|uniref:DUF4192 domain-containing protein n=1 Tax=Nocardia crassostreae TaxID=53428 RepID=UPI000AFE3E00|nr:DUF4192 domain-containing protein [Nocardia crassostreae]
MNEGRRAGEAPRADEVRYADEAQCVDEVRAFLDGLDGEADLAGSGVRGGGAPLCGSPSGGEPRLRDPGDFIAAIPAMLGFPPARSLVVTVLRADPGGTNTAMVDVAMRLDLDNPGRAALGELLERVAGVCVRHSAIAAVALIVDDRATAPTDQHRGVRARKHRDLVHALEHRLDAEAIPLAGAWAVTAIGPDLPWWSLLGPARRGRQPDPASSLVTVHQVLDGRPMLGSRAELAELLAVDARARARVEQALETASAAAAQRLARGVRHGDPDSYTRSTVRKVLWHIANVESGVAPEPSELAELAVALRDKAVRDIMFGLAPGRYAAASERLWLQLARALPDPDRAEAAALVGYSAYMRGDGPLAGMALDAALTSDPEHRMAVLLDIGLHTGMRPQRLRRLSDSGREAAADLGIDLEAEQS